MKGKDPRYSLDLNKIDNLMQIQFKEGQNFQPQQAELDSFIYVLLIFRILKDTRKELWNHPQKLSKIPKAKCMARESLLIGFGGGGIV